MLLDIHKTEPNTNKEVIVLIENNIVVLYFDQSNFSKASKHDEQSIKLRLQLRKSTKNLLNK